MKTTIRINLPDASALMKGLTPHEAHPELGQAEQALAAAEKQLEETRTRLREATAHADGLPGRVRAGEARPEELHQALDTQRAAALVVPEAGQAVTEARQRLERAHREALAAAYREAHRRARKLQSVADELAPVLEELQLLEEALEKALPPAPAVSSEQVSLRRALHLEVEVPLAPALTWPPTRRAAGMLRPRHG